MYQYVILHAESATADADTSIWRAEEVAMHNIETAVLNNWTDGMYAQKLEETLEILVPETVADIFHRMTLARYQDIDSVFADEVSVHELGVRGPTYLVALALLFSDTQNMTQEEAYRQAVEVLNKARR